MEPTNQTKKSPNNKTSTTAKGRLVEEIVASLHTYSNVKVERNRKLPVHDPSGKSKRKREVDVLLTSYVAGYPIQFVIECKNEKNEIGSPLIDSFIGKLDDLGIPCQSGIFVSASGFNDEAVERAKKKGIKLLTLIGLRKDGYSALISEAVQSIVHLMLSIEEMSVTSREIYISYDALTFCNEKGDYLGSVPDLVYKKWINEKGLSKIGAYEWKFEPPLNCFQMVEGNIRPTSSTMETINVKVQISGIVIFISGQAEQHYLVSPLDNKVEKGKVNVSFEKMEGKYPIKTFKSESELESFIENRPEAVKFTVGRIKLPRILSGISYWPPSERAAKIIISQMSAFMAGKISDPRPFNLADIEGTDLRTIWEPVWEGLPII